MAPKKQVNKGTGFAAPTIGTLAPKGTKIKRNADGTISLVTPKKNKK